MRIEGEPGKITLPVQGFEKLSCRPEPINFLNSFQQQARLAEAPDARVQTPQGGTHTLCSSQSPQQSRFRWPQSREDREELGLRARGGRAGGTSVTIPPTHCQSQSRRCPSLTTASRPRALSNHRRWKAEGRLGPALPVLTQVRRGSASVKSPRGESRSANRREAREAGHKGRVRTRRREQAPWCCGGVVD